MLRKGLWEFVDMCGAIIVWALVPWNANALTPAITVLGLEQGITHACKGSGCLGTRTERTVIDGSWGMDMTALRWGLRLRIWTSGEAAALHIKE